MRNLFWFRNDLRVNDNEGFANACKGDFVLAVYCFDPRQFEKDQFGFRKTERYRANFLIETVSQLEGNLNKLNISLLVFHGKPEDVVPGICADHKIDQLFFQEEWTAEEQNVTDKLLYDLPDNIQIDTYYGQFLFHPEDIPYNDLTLIPNVFTVFRKKCEKLVKVRAIHTFPAKLPSRNLLDIQAELPTLETLGLKSFSLDARSAFPFRGGEDSALQRLDHYFWTTRKLSYYKRTRNGLIGSDYSSKFSPWLANGSISPRTAYWEAKRYEQEIVRNEDTYWLIFELIWRDYFKYISLKYGNKIFQIGGILDKDYKWGYSEEIRLSWINGTTAEPFVNANMRELAATGWMSNRGRQNVASYWSKELRQDWRIGAAYFESMLLDYDVHSNWGNWMYNSGVGNDPRDRKFNVRLQAESYDPKGAYQRLWLQETLF